MTVLITISNETTLAEAIALQVKDAFHHPLVTYTQCIVSSFIEKLLREGCM